MDTRIQKHLLYLNNGVEEELRAVEILEEIKMTWQGFTQAEINSAIIKEKKRFEEQARKILDDIAARERRQNIEAFFLAAYSSTSDIH